MGLVSKSIPNLINGVSQQPPALRLDSQGEAQENGLSDVVDGLKKRPPTKFLKKLVRCSSSWSVSTTALPLLGNLSTGNVQTLSTAELAAAYIHTYKRSGDEQYTIVILPDATTPIVLAYDILGNLRYESGKSSWLADGSNITYTALDATTDLQVTYFGNDDDTSYLVGLSATAIDKTNLTSTSVADATFIVNKQKRVTLDGDTINPDFSGSNALIYLKSTNYGRQYKITLKSKSGTFDGTITAVANTANANSSLTNNDVLKVSTALGTLRSSMVSSAGAVFEGGGQETQGSRSAVTGVEWRGIGAFSSTGIYYYTAARNLLEITLATDTYTADPTKLLISVGGTIVNYHVDGVLGWQYHPDHATNKKIVLPASALTVERTWQNGQSGSTYNQISRPQIELRKTIDNVSDVAVTLAPFAYTNEPYFVLQSPENGTLKDFTIIATDDDGGANLRVFKDSAPSFTSLPNQCIDGFRIGVVGDNNKKEDDFHVVFRGEAGSGYWKESVEAGLLNFYDLTTMPHLLRQDPEQVGSLRFSFDVGTWNNRVVGDDNTNPAPSFVGNTISDMVFHRNRLGFLAGENVIFSEAGSYFNFWRTTVRTLLDSDPIDVAVSQNEVSELKAALPIQDALLLFSELNQFTLTSSQLLTPSEVTIDQSTKFECDLTAPPVAAGNSAFFATKGGKYAGVREYYTEGDTEIKDATLVTSHVPEYLEGSMRKMVASTNENMLVCLTTANLKEAYIYKWYNQGNQRVQSSWSKWVFDTDVMDISFNNSNLYITFGDGRFETMAVRTDAPELAFSSLVSEPITTHFTTNLESSETTGFGTDFTYSPPRAAIQASADRLGERAAIAIGSIFSSRYIEFSSMDKETVSLTINGTTFLPANAVFTENAANGWKYVYRWETAHVPISFLEGLVGQVSNITSEVSVGLGLDGKSHDVLLDHRTRLEHSVATPITSLADLETYLTSVGIDPSFTSVTDNYNNTVTFVNFRGEIIAKGVDFYAKLAVRDYLYNTNTGVAKTHVENETTVNNYLFVGEPYTFKYTVSEQVFKPVDGDTTTLARFQLRNMTFNFNNTGTFDVSNETLGRPPAYSNFTGRLLGQVDNIIGYTAVVDTGNHTVNIQSQASNAKITISNDTHLPSTFQSAEWEGFVVLRNRRM